MAITFNAVKISAAPEQPVIMTVIRQRISHPIGVPGKSKQFIVHPTSCFELFFLIFFFYKISATPDQKLSTILIKTVDAR